MNICRRGSEWAMRIVPKQGLCVRMKWVSAENRRRSVCWSKMDEIAAAEGLDGHEGYLQKEKERMGVKARDISA